MQVFIDFYYGSEFDDKFNTGDYVYVAPFNTESSEIYSYYNIGDKVTIEFGSGNSKDYTILDYASLPYSTGAIHTHFIDSDFILPANEYITQAEQLDPIHILLNAEDGKEELVEKSILSYTEQTNLAYTSKATLIEEFKGLQRMYITVGGTLVLILALIGILNFVNAMLTSVITRKVELATLQSIGMTDRNMKQMLIFEGLIQAGIVTILTLTIGQILVYLFTLFIAGQTWFFRYHFQIAPLIICIPLLSLLCYIVPQIAFINMKKESIVERLRVAE